MNQLNNVTERAVCIKDAIISQLFFTFLALNTRNMMIFVLYPNT